MQKLLIICSAPRSGSSALLNKLNSVDQIGLIPEYDVPSMIKALDIPFQKYKFTSSKTWVKNVDRGSEFKQTTKEFLKYIPHPNSSVETFRKIYDDTFKRKNLKIIGEKYPRYWILDIESLLDNEFYDTKLLFLFRNPSAVQLSYQHRKKLSEKSLDIWSFNGSYQGIIHWILAWHVYSTRFLNYKNSLAVKYEDLASDNFNKSINSFLELNENDCLKLDKSPGLKEYALSQNKWWYFLSEITKDWDSNNLSLLTSKYNLKYFRKRYWTTLFRKPSLAFHKGFWNLAITLYFINFVIKIEKMKHRYKFLSWTLRRVL